MAGENNIPAEGVLDVMEGPAYGLSDYQQYYGDLGTARRELPNIMNRSFDAAEQELKRGERAGGMRMAQEAARGMAATMGGAGQMARGGGRSAGLRQSGMDFGRTAADFALDASGRLGALAKERGTAESQMLGETLPAISLGQAEASGELARLALQPQEEYANAVNQWETIYANNYYDSDKAQAVYYLLQTMTPGTPAYKYLYSKWLEASGRAVPYEGF